MSERIFENAVILSGRELETTRGYLKVKDGKIAEIGEGESPEPGVDMNRAFILPPFINGHTHLGDSVGKDLYQGLNQSDFVGPNGEKFRILEEVSETEKIRAMRESLYEMKESGVFAHCDFREEGLRGVRSLHSAEIEGIRTFVLSRPTDEWRIENLLSESDGVGLPSIDSLPIEETERIVNELSKSGKFLSFHVSETRKAHKKSLNKFDRSEIQRSLDFDPSFVIHGTWASRKDLSLLSEAEVPLVLCPRANCLLSDGIPPIKKAIEVGVELWLGTDNVSVCSPIILQELSFAWSLLRLQSDESGSFEARELLKAATVNPIDDLELSLGFLEPGDRAVFIVLSRGYNLNDCIDPYLGIVNRARVDNLEMFYCPEDSE